jgi:metal-responsive CopG/Arc/MetJ family transcriptional regulator
MTAITVNLPRDVVDRIDELREVELLSRSNWLRREIVLAVRESMAPVVAKMKAEGTA